MTCSLQEEAFERKHTAAENIETIAARTIARHGKSRKVATTYKMGNLVLLVL